MGPDEINAAWIARNISAHDVGYLAGRNVTEFLARTHWMTDQHILKITESGVCQAAVEWSSCMKGASGDKAYGYIVACTAALLAVWFVIAVLDGCASGWKGDSGSPPAAKGCCENLGGRATKLFFVIVGFYGTSTLIISCLTPLQCLDKMSSGCGNITDACDAYNNDKSVTGGFTEAELEDQYYK